MRFWMPRIVVSLVACWLALLTLSALPAKAQEGEPPPADLTAPPPPPSRPAPATAGGGATASGPRVTAVRVERADRLEGVELGCGAALARISQPGIAKAESGHRPDQRVVLPLPAVDVEVPDDNDDIPGLAMLQDEGLQLARLGLADRRAFVRSVRSLGKHVRLEQVDASGADVDLDMQHALARHAVWQPAGRVELHAVRRHDASRRPAHHALQSTADLQALPFDPSPAVRRKRQRFVSQLCDRKQ